MLAARGPAETRVEGLWAVHVGARALTSQALNIHAGHDDRMAVVDTDWGMLIARNSQEAADLTAIARRRGQTASRTGSSSKSWPVSDDQGLGMHALTRPRCSSDPGGDHARE